MLLELFERNHVPRKAKILDLSCGIGRHSINLAKKGYELVGYDISPRYVKKVRARAKTMLNSEMSLRIYQGEAAEVDKVLSRFGEKDFDGIIIMGNSLGFSSEEYDFEILRNAAHLAADACLLVIQTENRDWRIRNFQPFINFLFEKVEVFEKWTFNIESSTATGLCKFYERETKNKSLDLLLNLRMKLRLYSLHELIRLINNTGWSYLASYGSSQRFESVCLEDEHILTVGRKISK